MWRARVADVMNPMGSLVGQPFRNAADSYFHSSQRDGLFLAVRKRAIDPGSTVRLNFNPQVVLQQSLHTIVQLAEAVLENTTHHAADAKIGSLGKVAAKTLPDAQDVRISLLASLFSFQLPAVRACCKIV